MSQFSSKRKNKKTYESVLWYFKKTLAFSIARFNVLHSLALDIFSDLYDF
jgi:hypothetical protein